MAPIARLPSGEVVAADLSSVQTVKEARRLVSKAIALGEATSDLPSTSIKDPVVYVLRGSSLLDDDEELLPTDELSIVIGTGAPHWYAPGKYLLEGKDVLKAIETQYQGMGGWERKVDVHFTDGTSASAGVWRGGAAGEALGGATSLEKVLEILEGSYGFIAHRMDSRWPGGKSITIEWVPPEDPGEWQRVKSFQGMKCLEGEQRRKS
eukprot:TRINITY_DN83426_c0_g1_i1.p1 TRINITY_DN83426_c0_g1~~TRINITY_DN83426_c0_g1_i1.p1  ORF type:complete len:225 (-),score=58.62 TRINITY_DN83426_c0_g1_i1:180-803(-)